MYFDNACFINEGISPFKFFVSKAYKNRTDTESVNVTAGARLDPHKNPSIILAQFPNILFESVRALWARSKDKLELFSKWAVIGAHWELDWYPSGNKLEQCHPI
ncbi:hypothetical protein BpHYR1_007255 [Brachionus plicatilis]|uniref:Uncharacterized protein n=1 Tax=Brachionus plicatilis TaxID=10195 RepID=A0A3M7T8F1_BRAPC|nr:hypothetical protein BpHYR1_007255 [Brachionus plicatilis]